MKRYKVEPDIEALRQRSSASIFKHKLLILSGPIFFSLIFVGSPWVIFYISGQKFSGTLTVFFILYTLLSSLVSVACLVNLYQKKDMSLYVLSVEITALIYLFFSSLLFAKIGDFNSKYFFVLAFFFVFFNFLIWRVAITARAVDIDELLAPMFFRKKNGDFICNPTYKDENFHVNEILDEIIKKTRYGPIVNMLHWLFIICMPIFIYVFFDAFSGNDEVSSGLWRLLSVGLFLMYIVTRKAYLYQLLLYRAIRRREMGFGVADQ